MKLTAFGRMTAENAETMKGLIKSGLIAAGVFETADCQQSY